MRKGIEKCSQLHRSSTLKIFEKPHFHALFRNNCNDRSRKLKQNKKIFFFYSRDSESISESENVSR